jgi:hypothetical protein
MSWFRMGILLVQLTAFAKRGIGLTVLHTILAAPLKRICAQTELNLEIDPLKVVSFFARSLRCLHRY